MSGRPRGLVRSPATTPPAPGRAFVWGFGVVMVLTAGTAFVFKLVEFFFTATNDGAGALGSFLIPLANYLLVAAGFLCLFAWSWLTGQFRDVEAAKHRMLELQDEIDARERARGPAGG